MMQKEAYTMNDKQITVKYTEGGYLDVPALLSLDTDFIFCTGGRGIGKTYGFLKYYAERGEPVVYLRRLKNEADVQAMEEMSAYKKVLDDLKINWEIEKIGGKLSVVKNAETGQIIAYNLALATFANMRGISLDDVQTIIYDEFVPEQHVRKMRGEGMALANLYESINRNRELEGKKPVRLIGLSNAFDLGNPVYEYFGLIEQAEQMYKAKEEIRIINNVALVIPLKSPVSEAKQKTALYQAINKDFVAIATGNKFALNDASLIKKVNLREYKVMACIGDLYFYRHKSDYKYYVCKTPAKTKETFDDGEAGKNAFARKYWRLWPYYMDSKVLFDSYASLVLFKHCYNK